MSYKLQALVAAKSVTVAQNAISSFVGCLKTQAIILLVVALMFIVLGDIWHARERKHSCPA